MDAQTLRIMLESLPLGVPVKITFSRKIDREALQYMNRLHFSGNIGIDEIVVLNAVVASMNWEHGSNRTMTVTILRSEAIRVMAHAVSQAIEQIRPMTEQRMHGLLTKRKNKRDKFIAEIVAEILTPDLVAEVKDWGLRIEHEVIFTNPRLPQLVFTIMDGETEVNRVTLDGWSGRIYPHDTPLAYNKPEVVQGIILKMVEDYMEAQTG